MRKRIIIVCSSIGFLAVCFVLISRSHSQSLTGDLHLTRVIESFGSSAQPRIIDNVTELIRPDGSRSITKIRSFASKSKPGQWDAEEGRTLYLADTNVTYDIFPLINMYGSLPVGKSLYRPVTALATCSSLVSAGKKIAAEPITYSKFGHSVEEFTGQRGDARFSENYVIDMYPQYGCLTGDQTSEIRDKSLGTVIARKIERFTSFDVVPDDPAQFQGPPPTFSEGKPSELIRRNAEVKGAECPECLLNTATRADGRFEKLWRARQEGKR